METESKSAQEVAADSIVLEEEIDPNYVPSEPEVVEYAKWLGMDLEKDTDLYWIAREGLMAPLPKDWKPCKTKDTEDVYYFNFTTGESTWDHPCDGYYKRLYEEEKKKKETVIKVKIGAQLFYAPHADYLVTQESGDQNRSKAKMDVEQLLGKADKKKKKKNVGDLGSIDMVKPLPAPLGLQRKPLPDLAAPLRASGSDLLGPGKLLPKPGSAPDLRISASLELPRGSALGTLSSSIKPLGSLTHSEEDRSGRPSTAPSAHAAVDTAQSRRSDRTAEAKESSSRADRDRDDDAKDHPPRRNDDDKQLSQDSADRELGRLDVTASLDTRSRTLQGRRGQESTGLADDEKVLRSASGAPVEEKGSAYTETPQQARPSTSQRRLRSPSSPSPPSSPAPSGNTDALQTELVRWKDKCAGLERQLQEARRDEAQYRASYEGAKEELQALERRFESSQAQWREKLRALEAERDTLDAERRRLKFELLDVQDKVHPATTAPSHMSDAADSVAAELQQELRSAQAALARSAATHTELQEQVRAAEASHQRRLVEVEAERVAAVAECERLTTVLREIEQRVTVPLVSSSADADRLLELERQLSAREEELRKATKTLANEQSRCAGLFDQIRAMGEMGEAQARDFQGEKAALTAQVESQKAQLTAALADLEALRATASQNGELLRRVEAAEAQQAHSDRQVTELKGVEANLRREIADLQRRTSEDQEQILTLQAERSQFAATETDRSVQFETFTSQATAVRKGLKTEVERLKTQLQDVESERSSLLTQLTRQETTLQFAKKELNDVAGLREGVRQLEAEKTQLGAQLAALKEASAAQAAQEAQLRERCDRLLQAGVEEEGLRRELRAENVRLSEALEGERTVLAQKEKKIKSYQEELLQLQRRLAETTATQARDGQSGSVPSSPVPFMQHAAEAAQVSEMQRKLSEHEQALVVACAERDASNNQVQELLAEAKRYERAADQLRGTIAALQQQLEARTAELGACRRTVADEMAQRDSTGGAESARVGALLRSTQAAVVGLESDKLSLGTQLRELRSQLASAQLSLQLQASSAKLVEEEAQSYRDKWAASERELSELRVHSARAASGAEMEVEALRTQLSELQAINEINVRSANELRYSKQECSGLRATLLDKDAQLAAAMTELASLKAAAAHSAGMGVAITNAGAPAAPLNAIAQPPASQIVDMGLSAGTHHIVALSMEVGRQQASMQRMEEHLRNTERLLLEFRAGAAAARAQSSDDSVLPSAVKPKHSRGRDRDYVKSRAHHPSAESPADASPESVSLLPTRQQQTRASSRRQGSEEVADSDSSLSPTRSSGVARDPSSEVSVSTHWIASLIRRYDLHDHEGATLSATGAESGLEEARGAAQRALAEGKTRLKQESRCLRDLQAQCAAAKSNLVREQEAVKNLKALWRSGKGRGEGSSRSAALNSDSINAVTALLNDAVDELRAAQTLSRDWEQRTKALGQSVQYLDEVLNAAQLPVAETLRARELAGRLHEVARSVQRKCLESADQLAAVVSAATAQRPGAEPRRAVSWTAPLQQQHQRGSPQRQARQPRSRSSHGGGVAFQVPAVQERRHVEQVQEPLEAAALPFAADMPAPSAAARAQPSNPGSVLNSIRSNEAKARILQSQIEAITLRQSVSKDICEKHAGYAVSLRALPNYSIIT
jgi:chromosome segregation ATPase